MIVTIDGPAGSGKSSVARQLAERLGFAFLDTGAMYRAVAYRCVKDNVPWEDQPAIETMAESLPMTFQEGRLYLDGMDATDFLRTPEVSAGASRIAVLPAVRSALVKLQRQAAAGKDIVTEGRDQGTVVFPSAECKFFVTADPRERARRRLQDLQREGHEADFDEVLQEIHERDQRDANRPIAPLKPADDAQIIDTTAMEFEEVLRQLEHIVRQRMSD